MTLDARGDLCPVPVIKTRKALKTLPEGEHLKVDVDNDIAAQNIEKMCVETGWASAAEKISDAHYIITIGRDAVTNTSGSVSVSAPATPQSENERPGNDLVVISSSLMGTGDDELGAALMKSFLFALAEADVPPAAIVFYNGGAKLTAGGAGPSGGAGPVVDNLKRLEAAGTKIYTCGACLNFYGLTEQLAVGSVTNMYAILEMMRSASRVVRP